MSLSVAEFVTSSTTFVAAITRAPYASTDRFLRRHPAVLGQPQEAHEVYEGRGEIKLAAKFTGGIVKGECVMVVVEAFP